MPPASSHEMNRLPKAPPSLAHEGVTIVFSRITDGDAARGFVPGYRFKIFNDQSEEVGHLNFRVGDTEHVRLAAGHIGFEVAERHRGNRYACKACLAAAPWISQVTDTVLITADPDNMPSIRTIEKLGATLLDEVDVPPDDPHYLRGSVRKRRYQWKPGKGEQAGAANRPPAGEPDAQSRLQPEP